MHKRHFIQKLANMQGLIYICKIDKNNFSSQSKAMESFVDSAISVMKAYVNTKFNGNVSEAARSLGMSVPTLHTWIKGNRKPTLSKMTPFFDAIGAKIALPTDLETDRNVCFVNAKIVPAGEGTLPPDALDYIAAPMVGEAGAGPGYLPQNEIKSWFLVYKHQNAVRYRRNLIAVEIGEHSTSMQPTLSPKDIVLVDRDDRDVSRPGRMMLVLDPADGSGMIKRVAVTELGSDFRITYYSDNTAENPPSVYSLEKDFDGDWEKAIVGRVVWAWSDVREK